MILRIAFICQTAIALLVSLFLIGCAATPGSPCAGYFMCFN